MKGTYVVCCLSVIDVVYLGSVWQSPIMLISRRKNPFKEVVGNGTSHYSSANYWKSRFSS